ncbi:uncharacterized protein BDZ99DRAFT_567470 [Mytilinidion resinicola]|uniref:Uncharacterized protein n=1 Tax=Mytilinidion resinicola TaxID=574789 RepID=A0A6A6YYU4_9PEZI|nr:uncharacterized protein BDZ99DRAFT_567470 [Mytilinidion resinicola]KAF2813718.1 hypothetical protein BDZ99DRAFT_567470 [Mytilinidion resinicola]
MLSLVFPTSDVDWDRSVVARMIANAAMGLKNNHSSKRNLQVSNVSPPDFTTDEILRDLSKAQHLSDFIALAIGLFYYRYLFKQAENDAYMHFLHICTSGDFEKLQPMVDAVAEPRKTTFAESCKNALRGRRAVATDRWFGLASACVQADLDDVWLLRGAKVPFLLRPVGSATAVSQIGGTHKLCGELYGGLGLMHGEMSGLVEKEGVEIVLV